MLKGREHPCQNQAMFATQSGVYCPLHVHESNISVLPEFSLICEKCSIAGGRVASVLVRAGTSTRAYCRVHARRQSGEHMDIKAGAKVQPETRTLAPVVIDISKDEETHEEDTCLPEGYGDGQKPIVELDQYAPAVQTYIGRILALIPTCTRAGNACSSLSMQRACRILFKEGKFYTCLNGAAAKAITRYTWLTADAPEGTNDALLYIRAVFKGRLQMGAGVYLASVLETLSTGPLGCYLEELEGFS